VTYLDTHVAVWVYAGESDRLSTAAQKRVGDPELFVSPMVMVELQLLWEVGRLKATAQEVVDGLASGVGVRVCELPFRRVVEQALNERWTRDPFDRLIVAHAKANGAPLITKDERIRRYYRQSVW